jgi:chemotaxis-related protein WspB
VASRLFLTFELGQDRYAFDVAQVAEVLPLVRVKQIPQAPRGVAGLFSYRGTPVPVVDLCELMLGRPAPVRLSTRLILVHYAQAQGTRLLGLIAEHATGMMRREAADFADSGIGNRETPALGPVTSDDRGVIQWVDVNRVLPSSLRDLLFQDAGGV